MKSLYPWGIDFSNFPTLRTFFNDNLFQNFFLVAIVTAVVCLLLFYFVISNFRAYLAVFKIWFVTGFVGSMAAGLFTFFNKWSAVAKAYTAGVGNVAFTSAITEGMIKYAITNVFIAFILYFIISLLVSPFRANVNTIPINWKWFRK
ncbi:MAG TPA: hypothetical protein PK239_14145 [Chitinophagales bacterium]|nr:hypothetical protein [Chitinophagales bacterium]